MALTLTGKAGEEGKLFGSITAQDIADALAARATRWTAGESSSTTRSRPLGQHTVEVRLHPEVHAEVRVSVVAGVVRRRWRAGSPMSTDPGWPESLFAAADWVAAGRDEINRINVFPVPDGDTGTNFSLTLRAVADALRALGDAPLPDTARTMARAAVLGARGNSGMMLAHFLLGFAERSATGRPRRPATSPQALRRSDRLYESLDDPREGTILTVARDAAAAAERAAADTGDIGEFMRRLCRKARRRWRGRPS